MNTYPNQTTTFSPFVIRLDEEKKTAHKRTHLSGANVHNGNGFQIKVYPINSSAHKMRYIEHAND